MTQPASKRFVMEDALATELLPIETQLSNVINDQKLINGGFDIWQRGTSFTSAGWTADRWKADSLVATTVGRVALASGSGSTYGLTLTATNATNSISLSQPFESININPLRGKTVTLSFDAVATVAATLTHNLQGSTTADNSSASFSTVTGGTGSTLLTTVPVKITRTVTIPSTSASAGFRVNFATSNIPNGAIITISNVKLEIGSIATAFCHNTDYPTSELQACQRYFEKTYALATIPGTATSVGFYSSSQSSDGNGNIVVPVRFSVSKRIAPIMTGYVPSTGVVNNWTWRRAGTGGAATVNFDLFSEHGGRAYVGVGAAFAPSEVDAHWTANAEL